MIGYWHDTVVCLSICLSVTKCIVALRVGVGVESRTVVGGHFLFTSSGTFAVGSIGNVQTLYHSVADPSETLPRRKLG